MQICTPWIQLNVHLFLSSVMANSGQQRSRTRSARCSKESSSSGNPAKTCKAEDAEVFRTGSRSNTSKTNSGIHDINRIFGAPFDTVRERCHDISASWTVKPSKLQYFCCFSRRCPCPAVVSNDNQHCFFQNLCDNLCACDPHLRYFPREINSL